MRRDYSYLWGIVVGLILLNSRVTVKVIDAIARVLSDELSRAGALDD